MVGALFGFSLPKGEFTRQVADYLSSDHAGLAAE